MYTIKHAAQQVGVGVSTLRAWERRYGVGSPQRSDAGYRLYDDDAIRALRTMNSLILAGWPVRAAAEEVSRRHARAARPDDRADPAASGEHSLVRAAETLDPDTLAAVLDAGFARDSFETAVDTWLLPGLREVGVAWASGRLSVAAEHSVAAGVTRRLSAAYDATGPPPSGPRAVIGLPPGARHDLGLMAFATALRRRGVRTTYLGADVPTTDWAAVAQAQSADCVVLAAPMEADAAAVAQTVASVRARRPHVTLAVGGSAQDLVEGPALRLGHEIGAAAQTLAEHLTSTRQHPEGHPDNPDNAVVRH